MRLALVVLSGCNWAFGISEQPIPDAPPPGSWASVAIAPRHACAVDLDGQLYCWGDPTHGRLGTTTGVTPQLVPGGPWRAVATGHDHTCALDAQGRAWCWGENSFGQVTGGADADGFAPALVSMPTDHPSFVAIAASAVGTCALGDDGRVFCWGDPGSAKGSNTTSRAPEPIGPGGFTAIAMGYDHACALATDGAVWCWGSNGLAQTGQPKSAQAAPAVVALSTPATAIAAGEAGSCAVVGGAVWCWGASAVVDTGFATQPPTLELAGGAVGIAVGNDVACATANGQASCWGIAQHGGLGNGAFVETVEPTAIAHTLAADAIALSGGTSNEESGCALANGSLACWGDNRGGQLGSPATLHATPVFIPGTWRKLSVGVDHTCAVDDSAALACWGSNDAGQATGVPGADASSPTTPAIGTATDDIVAGKSFTCARNGLSIDCWGSNRHGALAVADPNAHAGQVKLDGAAVRVLIGGGGAACVTNPVACWGQIAGIADVFMPTAPNDPNKQLSIAPAVMQFGPQASCALNPNGQRTCWGYQAHGQLGDGVDAMGTPMVPQNNNDIASYQDISLVSQHVCAAGVDGKAYCWGTNGSFESGEQVIGSDGKPLSVVTRPQPLKSASGTLLGCTRVAAGDAFSCAVCGTEISCWGANLEGELGRGSTTPSLEATARPVVLADAAWTDLGAGKLHACALAVDAKLACWGLSDRGQIGDGSHGSASPVAIAHP